MHLMLTFQRRQLLQLNILRISVARGTLTLFTLLLERTFGERVDSIHKRAR